MFSNCRRNQYILIHKNCCFLLGNWWAVREEWGFHKGGREEVLTELLLVGYEVMVSFIQHHIFRSKNDLKDLAVSYHALLLSEGQDASCTDVGGNIPSLPSMDQCFWSGTLYSCFYFSLPNWRKKYTMLSFSNFLFHRNLVLWDVYRCCRRKNNLYDQITWVNLDWAKRRVFSLPQNFSQSLLC